MRTRAAKPRALRLIGAAFVALAVYITVQSAVVLLGRAHPASSPLGIAWTSITAVVMFSLTRGKTVTGRALGNPVLQTEGRVTFVDGLLATAVLVGLALNAALGWWWADPLAGLVIVFYGVREAHRDLHRQRDRARVIRGAGSATCRVDGRGIGANASKDAAFDRRSICVGGVRRRQPDWSGRVRDRGTCKFMQFASCSFAAAGREGDHRHVDSRRAAAVGSTRDTGVMAFVYRRSEVVRSVPGATVRLVAVTAGVDLGRSGTRFRHVCALPWSVEVESGTGRVELVRTPDLDRLARVAIVVIGVVATAYLRKRRSGNE